jgi:hypothetical protein
MPVPSNNKQFFGFFGKPMKSTRSTVMIDADKEAAAKARKAARARAWYAVPANKEVAIARARAWNAEHRQQRNEYQAAYMRIWRARRRPAD